jgi:hypothetical protein
MWLVQTALLAATAVLLLAVACVSAVAWRVRRQLARLGHRSGRFQSPGWALLLVGVNVLLGLGWVVLLAHAIEAAP